MRDTQALKAKKPAFGQALKWAYALNGFRQIASVGITYLLAGLLGPREYGIVAMAVVVIAFAQDVFIDQGLSAAVIQRKDLKSEHLNAAFWLVSSFSVLFACIVTVFSSWWGKINNMPEVAPVLSVLAWTMPLQGLSVVQQALLQREMAFKALAFRGSLSVIAGGVVGVYLALDGWGAWSLVGQRLAEAVVSTCLLWVVAAWRPGFSCSSGHLRDLLSFSSGVMMTKVGLFLANRIDALVIGLFMGPLVAGLYRLAERTVTTLQDFVTRPLSLVSLPEFSKFQDDRDALANRIKRSLEIATLVALPSMALLAALGEPLFAVLGQEWVPAAGALALFCLLGVAKNFTIFSSTALVALGRTHIQAAIIWVLAIVSGVCFVLGNWYFATFEMNTQLVGVSAVRVISFILVYAPVSLWVLVRFAGVPLRWIIQTSSRPALIALAGALTALVIRQWTDRVDLWPAVELLICAAPASLLIAGLTLYMSPELRARFLKRAKAPVPA